MELNFYRKGVALRPLRSLRLFHSTTLLTVDMSAALTLIPVTHFTAGLLISFYTTSSVKRSHIFLPHLFINISTVALIKGTLRTTQFSELLSGGKKKKKISNHD